MPEMFQKVTVFSWAAARRPGKSVSPVAAPNCNALRRESTVSNIAGLLSPRPRASCGRSRQRLRSAGDLPPTPELSGRAADYTIVRTGACLAFVPQRGVLLRLRLSISVAHDEVSRRPDASVRSA